MASLLIQNKVELHYQVDGAGDTVWLLFNGATLPLQFWDPVASALAHSNTVIRFDQRNAGATQARGEFSLLDTASDAAVVLHHLSFDRVIVAGHAWGGRAAQVFVRDYPHLARGLVVCGTGGQLPARVPADVLADLNRGARERERTLWENALQQAFCAPGFKRRDPAAFQALSDLLWRNPPNREAHWNADIAPSPSYWGQTQLPALLIYGVHDLNGTPENAADLQSRLPQARLVNVPDAGHFVVREAPGLVVKELLAFADQLSG